MEPYTYRLQRWTHHTLVQIHITATISYILSSLLLTLVVPDNKDPRRCACRQGLTQPSQVLGRQCRLLGCTQPRVRARSLGLRWTNATRVDIDDLQMLASTLWDLIGHGEVMVRHIPALISIVYRVKGHLDLGLCTGVRYR